MAAHDELEAAYRATSYFVDAPEGRFAIRIGEPCPALNALLQAHGATTWAFITAHNPGSLPLPEAENLRRQRELQDAVAAAGFSFYPGEGIGDMGAWPPERSLLIVGASERQAQELAGLFGQAALVLGTFGEPARLAWLDQ